MTGYSFQPRDQIFVKGYWFLSFAKNMVKIIPKNVSKNIRETYCQKLIYSQKLTDYAEQSATGAFKIASKKRNSKNSRSNWRFDW